MKVLSILGQDSGLTVDALSVAVVLGSRCFLVLIDSITGGMLAFSGVGGKGSWNSWEGLVGSGWACLSLLRCFSLAKIDRFSDGAATIFRSVSGGRFPGDGLELRTPSALVELMGVPFLGVPARVEALFRDGS